MQSRDTIYSVSEFKKNQVKKKKLEKRPRGTLTRTRQKEEWPRS